MKTSYDFCQVRIDGRILEVTIDRPERRNALHPAAMTELHEVWTAFATERELWAAILTGAGDKAFSAGNDLKFQASGEKVKFPETGFGGLVGRRDIEKPIIAAVNGVAMGGGFEMALACDLIVAAEHATFALPEVKVGLIAGSGGLMRLPNQIPAKIASEMIFTGRPIDASRAAHLGLVNAVVALADLMQTARNLAQEIVANSPTSVRLSKRVLSRAPEHDVPEGFVQVDKSILEELTNAADTREGVVAFAEKRAPNWVNG